MLGWGMTEQDRQGSVAAQLWNFVHGQLQLKTLAMNFQLVLNLIQSKFEVTNLNEGIGEPWAGHDRARPVETFLTKFDIVLSAENLGAEPPIGSKDEEFNQDASNLKLNGHHLIIHKRLFV